MRTHAPHERPPATSKAVVVVVAVALALAAMGLISVGRTALDALARDPGGDGKTRVLFVGDSLMLGASGEIERRFEEAGAETRFVGGYGTGLLSGQGWWVREIEEQVDTWRPDVVVIEACCNYGIGEPLFRTPEGVKVTPDTEDMYTWWAAQAEDAVDAAGAAGAAVSWVTAPAADDELWPLYTERIPRFNEIVDDLGVARIDWSATLTPEGTFRATAPIDGKDVRIRDADGLHLTEAGNRLVVELTFEAIKDDLGLV